MDYKKQYLELKIKHDELVRTTREKMARDTPDEILANMAIEIIKFTRNAIMAGNTTTRVNASDFDILIKKLKNDPSG